MAEKAILAGMRFAADAGFDKSMREMKALAEAAGMEVADTFVQDGSAVNPGTYIGSGKIQEIRAAAEMEQADVILFNNTLTPMQMKNLVDALDREIIDRTALILRIFAERAGTREARLQVESANLQYMLPRLAGLHKELGRQGGAICSICCRVSPGCIRSLAGRAARAARSLTRVPERPGSSWTAAASNTASPRSVENWRSWSGSG